MFTFLSVLWGGNPQLHTIKNINIYINASLQHLCQYAVFQNNNSSRLECSTQKTFLLAHLKYKSFVKSHNVSLQSTYKHSSFNRPIQQRLNYNNNINIHTSRLRHLYCKSRQYQNMKLRSESVFFQYITDVQPQYQFTMF